MQEFHSSVVVGIGHICNVCLHRVHYHDKAPKCGLNRLSSELGKVLILTTLCLKQTGLDLGISLMRNSQCSPDIVSKQVMTHSIELTLTQTGWHDVKSLIVCLSS